MSGCYQVIYTTVLTNKIYIGRRLAGFSKNLGAEFSLVSTGLRQIGICEEPTTGSSKPSFLVPHSVNFMLTH